MSAERFFESFHIAELGRKLWEAHGLYWFPVPREHAEGSITRPLVSRIRSKIKQRGFDRLASHSAITFSGYGEDPREIHQIPEIRAFWKKLDSELEELPALLTVMALANYNGPVQHLVLLGDIERIIDHPEARRHDIMVTNADILRRQAISRIMRAGAKYQLNPDHVQALVAHFVISTDFPQPKDGTT